jgi:6-phosphogluconolactonase
MRTLALTTLFTLLTHAAHAEDYWVYYGSYTGKGSESKGIYVSSFNAKTGDWTRPEVAAETGSPSFLAVHPSAPYLYSVGESSGGGMKGGSVCAWKRDTATGKLTPISQPVDSVGAGPCHIQLDPSGQTVAVANYGGGSLASYRVAEDGSLSPAVSFVQHEGSSVHPKRQTGPHAHSVNFSPDGKYAFVADLGMDQIRSYTVDAATAQLTPHRQMALPPGSGPRHFCFHPSGQVAFTNGELLLNVTSMDYTAGTGLLTPIQTVSCLPEGDAFSDKYTTAEVVAHPSGKFVYVSVRGHDSIARYSYDAVAKKLQHQGNTPSGGQVPRNFAIDPSGRWLMAAHQKSHHVSLYEIDPATGDLMPTWKTMSVPAGCCVKFVKK